ncbi:hypothetical protein QYE76_026290 [Lolium multiflorum]|uniref:C2H2-type domain-containing protein n=1 Tax=Lolium multiflorum TaxID=4521 RepID=A0AAD8RK58_LOLMU|nr:hypothetical protein QYE76_026290 [Lolium multiflorum]
MADDQQPPRRGREIEEGEVVSGYHASAGSDTDTDDEDARYYLQSSHDNNHWVNVGAGSPASSFGSDWTVSDIDAGDIGDALEKAKKQFPCGVCGREFGSRKAVHGHMKVHAQAAKVDKKLAAVVSGGGVSAVEQLGDSVSTAVVVTAMPRLFDDTITPVQSACTNNPAVNGGSGGSSATSSMEPMQSGQSTVIAVAAHAPPAAAPEQVHVAPAPAAQQQATFIPLMVPAVPQQDPVGLHMAVGMAPAGKSQRGFPCRECDRWFPTYQGLGGHAAGHKTKRIAAEAAAAAAAGIDPQARGGARPAKSHACEICGAEYERGVSLGGHKRKHYKGKPIVPRKRLRPSSELYLPELTLALEPGVPTVAPPLAAAEPAAAPQPAQVAPAVRASVRIFGVDFVQQANSDSGSDQQTQQEEKRRLHAADSASALVSFAAASSRPRPIQHRLLFLRGCFFPAVAVAATAKASEAGASTYTYFCGVLLSMSLRNPHDVHAVCTSLVILQNCPGRPCSACPAALPAPHPAPALLRRRPCSAPAPRPGHGRALLRPPRAPPPAPAPPGPPRPPAVTRPAMPAQLRSAPAAPSHGRARATGRAAPPGAPAPHGYAAPPGRRRPAVPPAVPTPAASAPARTPAMAAPATGGAVELKFQPAKGEGFALYSPSHPVLVRGEEPPRSQNCKNSIPGLIYGVC